MLGFYCKAQFLAFFKCNMFKLAHARVVQNNRVPKEEFNRLGFTSMSGFGKTCNLQDPG